MSEGNNKSYEFYVGEKTSLEGAALEIEGTAKIDGRFSGNITVNHLIIGTDAAVIGHATCKSADVEGVIEDRLDVSGKLMVRSTGRVKGQVNYGSIQTEEGATLLGEFHTSVDGVDMSNKPKAEVSRLDNLSSAFDTIQSPKTDGESRK